MGLNDLLRKTLVTLSEDNSLLSWSIFHEKSGQISVKIRFEPMQEERNRDPDIHYRKKTSRQVQRDRERTQAWRAQSKSTVEKQQTGREHCKETPAEKPTPPGDVPAPVVGVQTRSMTTQADVVMVDTPENLRTTSTPEIAMDPPVESLTIDKMTCDISMLAVYQDPETSNTSSTASVRSDKTDDVDDLQESVDESEEDDTVPDSPPLWWHSFMEKTSQDMKDMITGLNITPKPD